MLTQTLETVVFRLWNVRFYIDDAPQHKRGAGAEEAHHTPLWRKKSCVQGDTSVGNRCVDHEQPRKETVQHRP